MAITYLPRSAVLKTQTTALFDGMVSVTKSRVMRWADLLFVGVIVVLALRLARHYIRAPRLPLPGEILTAVLLIGYAAYLGQDSQMIRGGLYNYLVEENYYGRVQTDKYALICAAWISRSCYEDIELSTRLSFRQAILE